MGASWDVYDEFVKKQSIEHPKYSFKYHWTDVELKRVWQYNKGDTVTCGSQLADFCFYSLFAWQTLFKM